MKLDIKIDKSLDETEILIKTPEITKEVKLITDLIKENKPEIILGIKDDKVEILHQNEIIRVYSELGKIYAVTDSGKFLIKKRLYEMENILDKSNFVRISNFEIANFKKVKNLDLSLTGTIGVKYINKEISYVSRRNVSKIKKMLGL